MITGYEIKKEGCEEVLILHLSYDVEFSLEFYKRKRGKGMKQLIEEFIKEKKIVWNGDKILLFFGGIALGTLLLFHHPLNNEQTQYVYLNDTILPAVVDEISADEESTSSIFGDLSEEGLVESIINSTLEKSVNEQADVSSSKIDNTEKDSSFSNKAQGKVQKSEIQTVTEQAMQSNLQTKTETTKEVASSSSESVKSPESFEQQVTIYRKNGSVLTLSMTQYLIGVVAAEMPASFPVEALKAQSVVARTYALKRIESGKRLTDDVSTQAYWDETYLRSIWKNDYDAYYNKIQSAVLATGQSTLTYNGTYIDAVYHSTSNGKTEDASQVWGNSVPYLKSVDSPWDQSALTYLRITEEDLSTVFQILGIDFSNPITIEILSRNESGRISSVRVGNQTYSGVEFRSLLGLRSADFDLEVQNDKLKITTRGYGHGVGMSQYGAKGMADAGYSYRQILLHYYPGTEFTQG